MTHEITGTLREDLMELSKEVRYSFRRNRQYFIITVGYLSVIYAASYVYHDFIFSSPLIKWGLLTVGVIGWLFIHKLSMPIIVRETISYPGDSILTANNELASAIKSKIDSLKYETYEVQYTFIDVDCRLLTASVYIWIKGPEEEFYRTWVFVNYNKKWEYFKEDFNDFEANRITRKNQ